MVREIESIATAGAAAAAVVQPDKAANPSTLPDPTAISSEMAAAISDQLSSFKEKIAQNQFLQPETLWQQGLSLEENGVVLNM